MTEGCPRTEDLSAHFDRQLGDEARVALEAHLATCAVCRGWLVDVRRLRARFQALPQDSLGFDLSQVIRGRIAAQPLRPLAPRTPRWRRLVPVGFGAAVSLSIGLAMGLSVTAPVASVTTTAAALEVFAPIAPGGLCIGSRSCYRDAIDR